MATSFVDLFQFYESTDYNTYEKLLFCLFIYHVEEKMIFGFSDHEDGGYVVPPTYFREFSDFMDKIRPIYDNIDIMVLEKLKNKYSMYDFGPECFDWNNPHKILSKILPIQ